MSDERRCLKELVVTEEFVDTLFTGDVGIVAGLPDDAKCRHFYIDNTRHCIAVQFSSDEFDYVSVGDRIPVTQAAAVQLDYSENNPNRRRPYLV